MIEYLVKRFKIVFMVNNILALAGDYEQINDNSINISKNPLRY